MPTITPTSPIPWLIPFATSSPADCVQFRKGSDSSTTFIVRVMIAHCFRQIKERACRVAYNVAISSDVL